MYFIDSTSEQDTSVTDATKHLNKLFYLKILPLGQRQLNFGANVRYTQTIDGCRNLSLTLTQQFVENNFLMNKLNVKVKVNYNKMKK